MGVRLEALVSVSNRHRVECALVSWVSSTMLRTKSTSLSYKVLQTETPVLAHVHLLPFVFDYREHIADAYARGNAERI